MAKEYPINTLADLYQIPKTSINAFCEDLRQMLHATHDLRAAIEALGGEVESAVEGFVWVDDGRREGVIRLTDGETTHGTITVKGENTP